MAVMDGDDSQASSNGHITVQENGDEEFLEITLAFLDAARYGDIDDIKELASNERLLNAQDSQGRTALHMAAANGHADIIHFLISSGVDLNIQNVEDNTPLHWAALNGHAQIVHDLIIAGANPSVLNRYERTPLDEALSREKMDVVQSINAAVAAVDLGAANIN